MTTTSWIVLSAACVGAAGLAGGARAQTPEQQQMWDAQRAEAAVADKLKAERLAR